MTFKSPLRGIQSMRKRHAALYGGRSYVSKVLGLGPIAYWPLWETSGTTAQCLVNSAQNGTYSSDVSGWPVGTGIGDGNTAPQFDGTNDYVNVYSAALASAFSGATGSMMIWAKVANSGVWTDGLFHRLQTIGADANNLIGGSKRDLNNQMLMQYHAGGTNQYVLQTTMTTTDWMCFVHTWDKPSDKWAAYLNAVHFGSSPTSSIGTWSGSLASAWCYLGQYSGGSNKWHGWLAHAAIWGRVLSSAEITALLQV